MGRTQGEPQRQLWLGGLTISSPDLHQPPLSQATPRNVKEDGVLVLGTGKALTSSSAGRRHVRLSCIGILELPQASPHLQSILSKPCASALCLSFLICRLIRIIGPTSLDAGLACPCSIPWQGFKVRLGSHSSMPPTASSRPALGGQFLPLDELSGSPPGLSAHSGTISPK